MRNKATIHLELSESERKYLRRNKVKKSDILSFTFDELAVLLGSTEKRAKEIGALAEFQQISSIGIEFAKDLVFLGYYKMEELAGKDGAKLTDEYERKKGYQTDPCVEDQFRLVVDFARNGDYSKKCWDFTNQRKEFRSKYGYPQNRPKAHWTQMKTN
jgi:hypothetical protein